MSDSGGSVGPGWLHAEGDPPGTQRYWDGQAWQGEPQPGPTAAPAAPAPAAAPSFGPPPSTGTPPAMAGPYGSPGFAEPKKKRSVLKWVLGIGLALLLGIGGCTYVLVRAVSGPIDTGNEFLAAIEARDFNQAWTLSDATCFDNGGPEQLEEIFVNETVTAYRLTGSNVNSTNGNTRGSTSGTVTFGADDVREIEIFVNKRGDDWLICGFDIDPAGG